MKCEIGHFLRLYFLDILAEMAIKYLLIFAQNYPLYNAIAIKIMNISVKIFFSKRFKLKPFLR
jgi:hypothetical protein